MSEDARRFLSFEATLEVSFVGNPVWGQVTSLLLTQPAAHSPLWCQYDQEVSRKREEQRQEREVPPYQPTMQPWKTDEVGKLDRDFVSSVHTRVECKTAMRSWRLLRAGFTSLAIKDLLPS
jgi:hypothetical protein